MIVRRKRLTAYQLSALDRTLVTHGSITGRDIERLVGEKQAKIRSSDGASPSKWRKALHKTTKTILLTKDTAMGFARLDPHKVAPLVLAGVYTIVQIIDGDEEQIRAAMTSTLKLGNIVSLWNCVEEQQIRKNQNESLKDRYSRLSQAIVHMFEQVIMLLAKTMAFFDSRWRKYIV